MIVQYRFRHRLHLYNRSRRSPLQFSSQTTPSPISHDYSLPFSTQTTFVPLVTSLSYLVFNIDYTWSERYRQFGFDFGVNQTYRLVMSLSCLVFITDPTWSDQSQQFNFVFGIDRICTISHIVGLFSFRHIQHPI